MKVKVKGMGCCGGPILKWWGTVEGSVLRGGVLWILLLKGRGAVEFTVMGDTVYLLTTHRNIK